MFYHSTLPNSSDVACQEELGDGDVVVPYEEVMSPDGRHFNHPECAEVLAQLAGGQLRRPGPPS